MAEQARTGTSSKGKDSHPCLDAEDSSHQLQSQTASLASQSQSVRIH